MSTVRARRPSLPEEEDEFSYGWRYVQRRDKNGRVHTIQVPLTAEDLLHPREGDCIPENHAHTIDMCYLANVFRARLLAVAGAVVLMNCRIAWDVPGIKAHGPDIAVIFGVRRRKPWGTFYVARERVRPTLLVEVTSTATRANDLGIKRQHYFRVGVPYYVIVDRHAGRDHEQMRLLGYRRGPRGYGRLPLDAQGRLWLEPVGVWLGVEEQRVVCYDAAGQSIPDYPEMATQVAMAKEQIRMAEKRIRLAEKRIRIAKKRFHQREAELRRLRGEE